VIRRAVAGRGRGDGRVFQGLQGGAGKSAHGGSGAGGGSVRGDAGFGLAVARPKRCHRKMHHKTLSIPLRRITLSKASAAPVGCFVPRSSCET
jgi:hypothetical protein